MHRIQSRKYRNACWNIVLYAESILHLMKRTVSGKIMLEYCSLRRNDPTIDEDDGVWNKYAENRQEGYRLAQPVIQDYFRREVTDRRISVEALGLARWVPVDADGQPVLRLVEEQGI